MSDKPSEYTIQETLMYLKQCLLPGNVQDGIDLEVPSWLVREAADALAALEQRVERAETDRDRFIKANAEVARLNADLAVANIDLEQRVEGLETLQEASIEFYCGVIDKAEWRIAVHNSPKGQELIALAQEKG